MAFNDLTDGIQPAPALRDDVPTQNCHRRNSPNVYSFRAGDYGLCASIEANTFYYAAVTCNSFDATKLQMPTPFRQFHYEARNAD
jgi:hypothetical protein